MDSTFGGVVATASPEVYAHLSVGDHFIHEGALYFVHEHEPEPHSDDVRDWLDLLCASERDLRWTAAQKLGSLSPLSGRARQELQQVDADPDAVVRRWVAWALSHDAPGAMYLSVDDSACDPSLRFALRSVELPVGEKRMAGRTGTSLTGIDILIAHGTVSTRHARIENRDGDVTVTDLGSTAGLGVNGRRYSSNVPVTVRPGERVRLGGLHFFLRDAPIRVAEPATKWFLRRHGEIADPRRLSAFRADPSPIQVSADAEDLDEGGTVRALATGVELRQSGTVKRLEAGDHFIVEDTIYFVHAGRPRSDTAEISRWIERLRSHEPDTRWTAVQMLGSLGAGDDPLVHVTIDELLATERDPVVLHWVEWLFGQRGPGSFSLRLSRELHRRDVDLIRSISKVDVRAGDTRVLRGAWGPCDDVRIYHSTVSYDDVVHVTHHGDRWSVLDVAGTGCVYVNEQSALAETELGANDTVRIRDVLFYVDAAPLPIT